MRKVVEIFFQRPLENLFSHPYQKICQRMWRPGGPLPGALHRMFIRLFTNVDITKEI
jgi:hypothetical protein